jgi:GxxExxY protein
MKFDELSNRVIGCAIEVHRILGPGLLENTYKQCLVYEILQKNMKVLSEVELPVMYKDVQIACGYRIDLLVEDALVIELKCVEKILPIHEAQLLTYMKLANMRTGLLINFNEKMLKHGINRFVL